MANNRVNAPVPPVTALANGASAAPVRPARYALRCADHIEREVRRSLTILLLLVLEGGRPVHASPNAPEDTVVALYSLSDGFDVTASIDLHVDGSFEFGWDGCTGRRAHASGTYNVQDGVIRFQPADGAFERDPRTFAEVMRRVRWGAREYLISDERMLAFVDAINAGYEPRTTEMGRFYLRRGDAWKAIEGLPELPGVWGSFLLPKPLHGLVVRIEQRETKTHRPLVVIDAGARDGLKPGMRLYASNPRRPHFSANLTIVTVEAASARATVPFQYNHIKEGDLWCSRPPRQVAVSRQENP